MKNTAATKPRKLLVIPMEIIERELNGKILLALEALKGEWECVIGTKRTIFDVADKLPPSAMLLKSIVPKEIETLRMLKNSGHRITSLDEEGLVQDSMESLAYMRFGDETIKEADALFCWGDLQRDALRKFYPEGHNKFITTGAPTADLWKLDAKPLFEKKIEDIQNRFGRYILIPSSFGVYNHFMGPGGSIEIMIREGMFRNEEECQRFREYEDMTAIIFRQFLELIPKIAQEFPDYTLIVRPHPSENHKPWQDLADRFKNFKVVFEGPISPWLMGAEAILHWGSTTGLEAHLMGKPVVGFEPLNKDEKDERFFLLPHIVSIMTKTQSEALSTLKHVLKSPSTVMTDFPTVAKGHEDLKGWIHGIENMNSPALIMTELEKLDLQAYSEIKMPRAKETRKNTKDYFWAILTFIFQFEFLKNLLPQRLRLGIDSRAYGKQKTKTLTEDVVLKTVSCLEKITQTSGTKVTALGKNLFWIYK